MKLSGNKAGMFRLGMISVALLLGQQAFAVGTDAGTSVSNQAAVVYDIGGNTQAAVNSNVETFLVDRVVTFVLAETDIAQLVVNPGDFDFGGDVDLDTLRRFTLTNTGNSPMDFDLVAADVAGTTVFGVADTANFGAIFSAVAANGQGGGGTPTIGTDLAFVDGLVEDDTVVIWVYIDTALAGADGDIVNFDLTATAADPGAGINPAPDGALGADLVASAADGDQAIDVVFNDTDNDGVEVALSGYEVDAATLDIVKSSVVISDPVSPGPAFFAIPGAVVEYTINISNAAGGASADGVVVTDTFDTDVTFETGNYDDGGTPVDVEIVVDPAGAATTTYCIADAADANSDGCSLDAGVLSVGGKDHSSVPIVLIDVVGGTDVDINYQVLIPN